MVNHSEFYQMEVYFSDYFDQLGHNHCFLSGFLPVDENSLSLDWKIRYKIAVGTARGLHYLHKGCQRRIIHRDIKASNVLLTADYEPQVTGKTEF